MTLSELGAKHKEARVQRELSVDDVIGKLKIPARVLTSIEEGDTSLPHTVYVFHYIKDYARLLGFSAQEVRSMTDSLEDFDSARQPVHETGMTYTPVHPSSAPRIFGTAARLVLALALGYGGYAAYLHFVAEPGAVMHIGQKSSVKSEPAAEGTSPSWTVPDQVAVQAEKPADREHSVRVEEAKPAAAPSAAPVRQEAASAAAKPAPREDTAQTAARPPQPAPDWNAPAAQQADSTFVTPAVAQNPGTASPPLHQAYILGQERPAENSAPAASSDAAALPEGVHQVILTADKGDCWIGYEPDGKKLQRNLRRGDSFTVTFNEGLRLRLGNAAAVNVNYDGSDQERTNSARPVNMTFPPVN